MTYLYSNEDYDKALSVLDKAKKKPWIIGGICLLLNLIVLLFKFLTEWGQPTILYQTANCVITISYAFWLIYYIDVPFRILKEYVKVYRSVTQAKPEIKRGVFLGIEEEPHEKNGIMFYTALFYLGTDSKGRETAEQVLIEAEKETPVMNIGDEVDFESCSLVLRAYEVVSRAKYEESETNEILKKLSDKLGIITVK